DHTHDDGKTHAHPHSHHGHAHEHGPHGIHGGPLVKTSKGQVELSVFETNVPPRFRLYFHNLKGKAAAPLSANTVSLETIRPEGARQSFQFKRSADYLEATEELPEPHEFTAVLKLKAG